MRLASHEPCLHTSAGVTLACRTGNGPIVNKDKRSFILNNGWNWSIKTKTETRSWNFRIQYFGQSFLSRLDCVSLSVLYQNCRTLFCKANSSFCPQTIPLVARSKLLHEHCRSTASSSASSLLHSHRWAVAAPCQSSGWGCSTSQPGHPSGQRGRPPPPSPPLCALPGCRRGAGSAPGYCGPFSPWTTARNAHQTGQTGAERQEGKDLLIFYLSAWNVEF